MSVLLLIIIGAFIGWLAARAEPLRSHISTLDDIVLGMSGALIGGSLMLMIADGERHYSIPFSAALAIIGAVLMVIIVHYFDDTGGRHIHH